MTQEELKYRIAEENFNSSLVQFEKSLQAWIRRAKCQNPIQENGAHNEQIQAHTSKL